MLNHKDGWGRTALHTSIFEGMEEISAELLENPKTDINAQDYFGITPLMYAAMIGNATTVAALLKKLNLMVLLQVQLYIPRG